MKITDKKHLIDTEVLNKRDLNFLGALYELLGQSSIQLDLETTST